MTRYIEILALQRPFEFDVDDNHRTIYSVNFTARASIFPVPTWRQDLATLLTGILTVNVDAFFGPERDAPSGDGPYTHIIDTSSLPPLETHDGSKNDRPSAQFLTRAVDPLIAQTKSLEIYSALDGLRGVTVP